MSNKSIIWVVIIIVSLCFCICVLLSIIFGQILGDDDFQAVLNYSMTEVEKENILTETILPSISPSFTGTPTKFLTSTPQPTITKTPTQVVIITKTITMGQDPIIEEMADYASKVLPELKDYNENMDRLSTIFFDIANNPSLLNSDVTKGSIQSTLNNMENSSYKMKIIESPDPVIQEYMDKIYSETLKMKSNLTRGVNFSLVSSLEEGLVNIQNIGIYLENITKRLDEYLLP